MTTTMDNEPKTSEPTRELIVQATRALAGVCDGAEARDGQGYNGVDSGLMKEFARLDRHTDRQLRTMWHILRKYKLQLDRHGIQYDLMVPPALQPRDTTSGRFQVTPDRIRMTLVETNAGPRIAIIFGYNVDIANIIREVEGRFWDKENRRWLIPADANALDAALAGLEAFQPPLAIDVAPEIVRHADAQRKARRASLAASRAAAPMTEIEIPTKLPLLPFQRAGVEYIDAHNGRALVADEMGLGKTAQAIGWLALRRETALPALVVVPAVVRVNWLREISKFSDLKAMIVVSKSSLKSFEKLGLPVSDRPLPGYDVVITNYDLCRNPGNQATINKIPLAQWANFKTLVLDEAHAIKEEKSQRTKVMLRLSMVIPHVICLTGTPLLNRPKEVWTLTQACNQSIFPKFFLFARRYCGAVKERFGWNFDGASNIEELATILRQRVMVRREKMDVLTELPDRRRVTFPISMNGHLETYKAEVAPILEKLAELRNERAQWKAKLDAMTDDQRRTFMAEHAEEKARSAKIVGGIVGEIAKMRKISGLSKIEPATDFILDTVDQAGKVIVFAHHHDVIDSYTRKIAAAGIEVVKIDGRDSVADRQVAIDTFQNGSARVIVLGIGAGGVGINLQAASNVIFVELPWRPGDVDQAEARAWRMGQKNAVTTYFLVGLGTIEESIAKIIDTKREVTNAVVDEADRTVEEAGIMDAILDDLIPGDK